MQSILRVRLEALINLERHLIWRRVLTGCTLFWIVVVVGVMGIR